ncbi:MAG TPA: DegV family protein, partial [Acidimicrobiia bacterium]
MAVRIVTDSSCDLPQPLCDELGIDVVPLTVRFGAEELLDRKEITTEQFWPRLSASSVLPETAAPPVGAFYETFKSLADTGADGIVCINISSKLSATLQSAQIAADRLEGSCPIAVVDSESASMGIGVHVLHAAR